MTVYLRDFLTSDHLNFAEVNWLSEMNAQQKVGWIGAADGRQVDCAGWSRDVGGPAFWGCRWENVSDECDDDRG